MFIEQFHQIKRDAWVIGSVKPARRAKGYVATRSHKICKGLIMGSELNRSLRLKTEVSSLAAVASLAEVFV